jgi:hypothetical protein
MKYSQSQIEHILYGGGQAAPVSQEPESSLLGRGLQHAGNLPSNVLNYGIQSMTNLGLAPRRGEGYYQVGRPFQPAPAQTRGEQIVDLVGEQVAPGIGWGLLTYGAGGAMAKGLGAGKRTADIAANVVSGGLTGAYGGPETAASGAAFGGLTGAASWIPSRMQRIAPLVGIGAADAYVTAQQTGSPEFGMVAGGLDVFTGLLPGKPNVSTLKPTGLPQVPKQTPRAPGTFAPAPSYPPPGGKPIPQRAPGTFAPIPNYPAPGVRNQPNPSAMDAVYGPGYWREMETNSAIAARRQAQEEALAAQTQAAHNALTQSIYSGGIYPPNREGMRRASSAAKTIEGQGYERFYHEDIFEPNQRSQTAQLGAQTKRLNQLFPGAPTTHVPDPRVIPGTATGAATFDPTSPYAPKISVIDERAASATSSLPSEVGRGGQGIAPWDYPEAMGMYGTGVPVKGFTKDAYSFGETLKGDARAIQDVQSDVKLFKERIAKLPVEDPQRLALANQIQFMNEALEAATGANKAKVAMLQQSTPERDIAVEQILRDMGILPEVTQETSRGFRHGKVGGRVMLPPEAFGGAIGFSLGSQIGEDDQERARNAMLGLGLGVGGPMAIKANEDMIRRGALNAWSAAKKAGQTVKKEVGLLGEELKSMAKAADSNLSSYNEVPTTNVLRPREIIQDETQLMKLKTQLSIAEATGDARAASKLRSDIEDLTPKADVVATIPTRREMQPGERPDNLPFNITKSTTAVMEAAERKNSFRYLGNGEVWDLRRDQKGGGYYAIKHGDKSSRRDFNTLQDASNYLDGQGLVLQRGNIGVGGSKLPAVGDDAVMGPLMGKPGKTEIQKTPQPGYNPRNVPGQLNLIESGMKKASKQGQQGFVDPRIAIPIASTLGGAAYGFGSSGGDIGDTAFWAAVGAGGGVISSTLLNSFIQPLTAAQKAHVKTLPLKEQLKVMNEMSWKDQAGRALHGEKLPSSGILNWLETQTGKHVPAFVKSYFTQARGAAAEWIQTADALLTRVGRDYVVPAPIADIARKYIKGQLIDAQDLQAVGALSEAQWKNMKGHGDLPTWQFNNQTYKLTPQASQKLRQVMEDKLKHQLGDKYQDYGKLIVGLRNSLDGLQELLASGLGKNTAQMIRNSQGEYVTQTYSLWQHPDFFPSAPGIQIAAKAEVDKIMAYDIKRMLEKGQGRNPVYRQAMTEAEYQDVLNTGKRDEIIRLQNFEPVQITGRTDDFGNEIAQAGKYYVAKNVKYGDTVYTPFDDLMAKTDTDIIAMRMSQEAREAKASMKQRTSNPHAEAINTIVDPSLLSKRKDMTKEYKEHVLGEITDPVEMLLQSMNRLVPSSVASKYIDSVNSLTLPNGLKASYATKQDWIAERDALKKQLSLASDPKDVSTLKSKLEEMNTYQLMDDTDLQVGVLKDAMVSRYVHNQLKGYSNPWGIWNTQVGESLQNINRVVKTLQTPYSPLTQIRNAITSPMFMAIGKATPQAAFEAAAAIKSRGDTYRELLRNGILTADEVTNELRRNVDTIAAGKYESELMKKVKKPFRNFHEFVLDKYAYPDRLVRASVYLQAKKRFANEMGKSLDDADVMKEAVAFTDRYTMNYDNISPLVRNLRRTPFVNMYISYAAETARIGKNLLEDAIGKGPYQKGVPSVHALSILGALAAGPEVLQRMSEASLPSDERKEWNQTQALSPDYSRTRFKIVLGKDKKGNFKYLDFTPLVISDNFNQMIRGMLSGDMKAVGATNPVIGWEDTPAFNIIAEQIAGKNLRNQREFRGPQEFQDRVIAIADNIAPNLTPGIGYEWNKLFGNQRPGITNLKTGREETIEGTILRYTFGTNLTSVNSQAVFKGAMAKYKNELSVQKQYLNDILKTTLPKDVKERELIKYRQAVQMITADLVRKLDGANQETPSNILPESK